MQHSQVEHQEPLGSNNETHGGLPRRKLSEPTGLDKLLGPGGNNILDMRSDKYEASFKKWSECSVEEWKAGAEGEKFIPFSISDVIANLTKRNFWSFH